MSMPAPRPGVIWTPGGQAILVRNDTPPKPRPRIGTIPYVTDLLAAQPLVAQGNRRTVAYCCSCQKTVYDADYEYCKRLEHELRYTLLPDLRKQE